MADNKPTREEIAMIELGRTTVSRPTALFLLAVLLVTIVTVPVIQTVHEVSSGEAPYAASVFTQAPSEQAFASFERELEDRSVVGDWVLPWMQEMLVAVGAGNEQAYLGRDGWLFYRPGFDYVTGRGFLDPDVLRARRLGGKPWESPPEPDPTPAIVSFRDQLRERGIELVLMPTTVKPQLDPTGAVATERRPLHNPSYAAWLAAMADAGVRLFDPSQLLAAHERAFLKTDTHWTAAAMRTVAGGLAAELKDLLPAREPAGYRARPQQHAGMGDIAVMLRLPDEQTRYGAEDVQLEVVEDRDGAAWRVDEAADVLLLGDSFTNIYSLESMGWGTHAGFAETLSLALQRPLDRIAINDAGAVQTRRALADELRRGRDRLAGKKVVVWQFAARELAVGDWQVLELPKVTAPAATRAAVTVTARVAALATPPQPGSVPYKDCLIGVRLEALEATSGTWPADEDRNAVLLYVAGMTDNKWTPAATWKPGQAVELQLVPWEAAPEGVRSLNRRELDDDELMLANPWFTTVR